MLMRQRPHKVLLLILIQYLWRYDMTCTGPGMHCYGFFTIRLLACTIGTHKRDPTVLPISI